MNELLKVDQLCLKVASGHIIQKQKVILDHVSFSVPIHSATAYLGPNGAGKTSTFRVLCRLIQADSGNVLFDGNHTIPPARLGFMPEQPYFYKNLTIREMLTGFGKISGMTTSDVKQQIKYWANRLAFYHVIDQKMSTCSKGQIQRAGLAQALLHRPDFLLLDEPLSGLDPMGRESVLSALQEAMKHGMTLLFSSHILTDAEALCDQVVVLNKGKTAFSGAISNLIGTNGKWRIRFRGNQPSLDQMLLPPTAYILDENSNIICSDIESRNAIISRLIASPETELLAVEPVKKTLEQAFLDVLSRHKQGQPL